MTLTALSKERPAKENLPEIRSSAPVRVDLGYKTMVIVTIVRFPPDSNPDAEPLSVDEARSRFGTNAHSYLDRPGLLWKAYLLAEDGRSVGGTYWWADRRSAEEAFNEHWLEGVTKKYGAAPTIEWFEAPVVVDARFDVVRVDAPPRKANS